MWTRSSRQVAITMIGICAICSRPSPRLVTANGQAHRWRSAARRNGPISHGRPIWRDAAGAYGLMPFFQPAPAWIMASLATSITNTTGGLPRYENALDTNHVICLELKDWFILKRY